MSVQALKEINLHILCETMPREPENIICSITEKHKYVLRACLHGGGGPLVGEVTRLGGVTRLSI